MTPFLRALFSASSTPVAPSAAGLLVLRTTSGQTADIGSTVTAALARGVTGSLQFTRNGYPISGAAGSGNSLAYTVQSADQDQLLNVLATDLTFSVALTSTFDAGAVFSFFGAWSSGSTLTAVATSGFTGTITIKRADGTTAATVSAATTGTYVLTLGDLTRGPFTAVLSNLVLTATISSVTGTPAVTPFLTTSAALAGSITAAGDVFQAQLPDGVAGIMNFAAAGTIVTSNVVTDNAMAYMAQTADAGKAISVVITHLQFRTGGLYGTPVLQSATGSPFLYSMMVLDSARSVIQLGYMPLANLDTSSLPSLSDLTLAGTMKNAKTITGVSIDNSNTDRKYVNLTVSTPFAPNDVATLASASTAIRYVGGAGAATFSARRIGTSIPPLATPVYPRANIDGSTSAVVAVQGQAIGTVLMTAPSNGHIAWLVFDAGDNGQYPNQTYSDTSVQMSILADWGTDTSIVRVLAFNYSPDTYSDWYRQQYLIYRTGNTVTLWQQKGTDLPSYATATAQGSSYTFSSPGANCLARLFRSVQDYVIQFQVSTNAGETWTTVSTALLPYTDSFFPTAYSSSATIPVTGVATSGFALP